VVETPAATKDADAARPGATAAAQAVEPSRAVGQPSAPDPPAVEPPAPEPPAPNEAPPPRATHAAAVAHIGARPASPPDAQAAPGPPAGAPGGTPAPPAPATRARADRAPAGPSGRRARHAVAVVATARPPATGTAPPTAPPTGLLGVAVPAPATSAAATPPPRRPAGGTGHRPKLEAAGGGDAGGTSPWGPGPTPPGHSASANAGGSPGTTAFEMWSIISAALALGTALNLRRHRLGLLLSDPDGFACVRPSPG
jgi:hypothetical protein